MSAANDDDAALSVHRGYAIAVYALEFARQRVSALRDLPQGHGAEPVIGSQTQLTIATMVDLLLTNETPVSVSPGADELVAYDEDDWDEQPPPLSYLYGLLLENLESQRRAAAAERQASEFLDVIGYANCPDDASRLAVFQRVLILGRSTIDDLIARILANDEAADFRYRFEGDEELYRQLDQL